MTSRGSPQELRKNLRKRSRKTARAAVSKRFCTTLNKTLCNFFKSLIQMSLEFLSLVGAKADRKISGRIPQREPLAASRGAI